MRYLTLALIALVGTGCGWPVSAEPVYDRVHGATLALKIGDASCSGTAVGKRTILTASHCIEPDAKTLQANGELCEVWKQWHDGKDHVLLRVTGCKFKTIARMGKAARTGDRIFLWGNPHRFSDILRFGHAAGFQDSGMPGFGVAQMWDFNGWQGDSGAALFNESGLIVAVVSIGSRPFALMGTFPIEFTRQQWDEAL